MQAAESVFRQYVGPQGQPPGQTNIHVRLTIEVLVKLLGDKIFETLTEHTMETELFSDHRVLLMKKVASTYLLIRLIIRPKSQPEGHKGKISDHYILKLFCSRGNNYINKLFKLKKLIQLNL